jgi:hypothetical protein
LAFAFVGGLKFGPFARAHQRLYRQDGPYLNVDIGPRAAQSSIKNHQFPIINSQSSIPDRQSPHHQLPVDAGQF